MNNFSPNMLKTFALCPKKYYFKYVQNISMPQPASVFEKGKKIHALAHYYLQGVDISGMLNALNEDEKFIWQRLCENEFFRKKYVNSEYNLSCKVGDYWVGGRLDALMYDTLPLAGKVCCQSEPVINDGTKVRKHSGGAEINNNYLSNYYIMDYKTGSIPKSPETDFQTMVYLICADKKLKEYASLKFIYIDLKNNRNAIIELTEERKRIYNQSLIEICCRISDTEEYPQNVEKCSFCEYKKLCI